MKRIHDLILSERIQNMKPLMAESEQMMLCDSIDEDGVLNPLVVWKGRNILVDGYYRYMYCHEKGIPFDIIEKEFADETEVVLWVVRQQLARRNLTAFQKCEMVLPLEAEIAAEAKKRQGWRSDLRDRVGAEPINTAKILSNMAGVSTGSLYQVKYILQNGDRETLRRVRAGELSIYGAYRSLVQGTASIKESATNRTKDNIMSRSVMNANLQPIKDAVEDLIDRVSGGDASPRDIVAELNRVAELIDDVKV